VGVANGFLGHFRLHLLMYKEDIDRSEVEGTLVCLRADA